MTLASIEVATTKFLFDMCNCTSDSDIGKGDFSLVLGNLHVCVRKHVRSHVSPVMDCRMLRYLLHFLCILMHLTEITLNFIIGVTFPLSGWSYECFCEWKPFVSLSVSSIISFICEWTFFEIGIIALGES